MSIKNKFRNRKFLSVLIIVVALTVCIVGALAFMIPSWTSYKSYYDAAVAEREHQKYINSLPLELVGITASLGDGVEYYDNGRAAPNADDFEVMAHFTEKGQSRDELLMSDRARGLRGKGRHGDDNLLMGARGGGRGGSSRTRRQDGGSPRNIDARRAEIA